MDPIQLAERGLVPDPLLRLGIRRLLRRRLKGDVLAGASAQADANHRFRAALARGPIAPLPALANAQHYEVDAGFFEQVLGPRLKYSCCCFDRGVSDLAHAESRMLELSCERAGVEDGMRLLDLGCGWGSLSLFLAERYPLARIVAVSNSKSQREHILSRCDHAGLGNVEVVTADVNDFEPEDRFDRVLSIEMFEHVRNQAALLARIRRWLQPDGALFVHHFAHRSAAYAFEDAGEDDWMARHFFSGGIMPSDDHLLHLQQDLVVDRKWVVNGTHYQRTAEAWLARQEANRGALQALLERVYGPEEGALAFHRWRLFFLACAELFGYRGGEEWWVVHARMRPRRTA